MAYTVIEEFSSFEGLGSLGVGIDQFPGWIVRIKVARGRAGLVLAEVSVSPMRNAGVTAAGPHIGLQTIGSRVFLNDVEAQHWPSDWSELAEDVPEGGIPARLIRSIKPGEAWRSLESARGYPSSRIRREQRDLATPVWTR